MAAVTVSLTAQVEGNASDYKYIVIFVKNRQKYKMCYSLELSGMGRQISENVAGMVLVGTTSVSVLEALHICTYMVGRN